MRGADDERWRGDHAAAPVPRRTGRLLVPLVVAGAAVVVLSTAVGGQARFAPLGGGGPQPAPSAPDDLAGAPAAQPSAMPVDPAAGSAVQSALLVLAGVVAAVVAALLIRLLVAAIRDRRRRQRGQGRDAIDATAAPEVADAPAVLRGIAAALHALNEDREPGDAVVRAWLGLQQAAEDAGVARSAAETPTEFTGRVLSRTGADRVPLQTLLRLYLRARFGEGLIAAEDAAVARGALRALETSWARVTA